MYKLSFIKFPIFGILALLLFGSAVVFLPQLPQVPQLGASYSMHVAAAAGAVLGSALIGAILFYLKSSALQKWQVFWGMLAFALLYGAIGNLVVSPWKLTGLNVEFNLAQMIVMCLGGIFTAPGFWKLDPVDQFGTGTATLERFKKGKHQPEAAAAAPTPQQAISLSGLHAAESAEDFMKQKGTSIKGLTASKTDLSVVSNPQEAVMAKKTGPSSLESAQAIMTPPVEIDLDAADEMLSGPLNASPSTQSQQSSPAQTPASPLGRGLTDDKRAPATTGNRLQAQKRRNTSTFTKLQALSASGTGSLKPGPQTDSGTGGGDLRSLLDRLDAEPESHDYETIAAPEEIRVAILFAEIDSKKSSEMATRPAAAAAAAPVKPPAPPPSTPLPKPMSPTAATAGGATTPATAGPQESKLGGLAARMQQKKAQSPAGPGGPKLASLLDRAEALADETPTAEPAAKAPAVEEFDAVPPGKPPAVEEFDAAPPNRDQSDSDLLSKRLMELSTDDDDVRAPAQSLTEGPEPTEERAETDKVFAEGVDAEVDDIFSNLASEEAQREVAHDEEVTEEEKAAQPEEVEQEVEPVEEESPAEPEESPSEAAEPVDEESATHEGPVFAAAVDGDVDDLFDNLAPAESQREVADRVQEKEPAQEEPAKEAEEGLSEGEGPIFAAGVDNDVDDLFDNLAPAESQREVSNRQVESEDVESTAEIEAHETAEPTMEIEAAAPAEEEVEEREGPLFTAGVDGDVDDLFDNLAPAEAQREVSEPSKAEGEPTEEESAPLFAAGVDGDVDDLFDNLAPAEAQREVGEASASAEAEPTEEESAPLFAAGVDGDVDDLFDNLAPAEAQKTVEEIRSSKELVAERQPAQDQQELTGDFEPEKEAEPANDSETLFQLGDSDVDDIFAGLAGSQLDVNAETLMKVKPQEQEVSMPSSLVETGDRIPVLNPDAYPKTPSQTGDMPSMSLEQADKVKAEEKKEAERAKVAEPAKVEAKLEGSTESSTAEIADADESEDTDDEPSIEVVVAKESPETATLKKELKEFGKLSNKSATAAQVVGENVGTMRTIGKLLIDNQAIENIIKAGEQRKLGSGLSTARVISSARGQGIMDLLHKIDQYEGVFGSLIVGHDGLVMASTLKEGWDKDMMGALSTALLSTSNLTTKKLEIGKLRQMVMLTKLGAQNKTTVLTDVDVGILAVFVEATDITKIDGLLEIIHKTIHG